MCLCILCVVCLCQQCCCFDDHHHHDHSAAVGLEVKKISMYFPPEQQRLSLCFATARFFGIILCSVVQLLLFPFEYHTFTFDYVKGLRKSFLLLYQFAYTFHYCNIFFLSSIPTNTREKQQCGL